MIRRINQFKKGLFASLGKSDYTFLADYLTRSELDIFKALPRFDQRHSIDVATDLYDKDLDMDLVRAGLLHDIGKSGCPELSLLRRSLCVVIEYSSGDWAAKKASRQGTRLERALFVHINHAEIGADILEELDCTEKNIIWLVRHHDNNAMVEKNSSLKLLKKADESA